MAPASEGEAVARQAEPSSTINHAGDDLIALGHLQRARTQEGVKSITRHLEVPDEEEEQPIHGEHKATARK
jgi:hypothetical protein